MPIKMPINGTTVPAIHLPLEDGYVLTGIPNYDGGKTKIPNKRSWWLTRQGWMKSTYCFSTPLDGDAMSRELTEQLTSLEEFKSLFKKVAFTPAKVKVTMSGISFIAEVPNTVRNIAEWAVKTFPAAEKWEEVNPDD